MSPLSSLNDLIQKTEGNNPKEKSAVKNIRKYGVSCLLFRDRTEAIGRLTACR